MIKLIFCIHRKPSLSREEFYDYWLNQHAALVKRLQPILGASRYVQSHRIDSQLADQGNQLRKSSVVEFDGITEIWWENETAMTPAGISKEEAIDAAKALLVDENSFIDHANSVLFMTAEHEIFSSL